MYYPVWSVVNEPTSSLPDLRYALLEAMVAVEFSDHKDSESLDTLAYAYYRTGHAAMAIDTQKKAIALFSSDADVPDEYKAHLAQFKAALAEETGSTEPSRPPDR